MQRKEKGWGIFALTHTGLKPLHSPGYKSFSNSFEAVVFCFIFYFKTCLIVNQKYPKAEGQVSDLAVNMPVKIPGPTMVCLISIPAFNFLLLQKESTRP